MSSKIVFKINSEKEIGEFSSNNVKRQLANLKQNINEGVITLTKKKSTVGKKEDDNKKETERQVKFRFRNLTEHIES